MITIHVLGNGPYFYFGIERIVTIQKNEMCKIYDHYIYVDRTPYHSPAAASAAGQAADIESLIKTHKFAKGTIRHGKAYYAMHRGRQYAAL